MHGSLLSWTQHIYLPADFVRPAGLAGHESKAIYFQNWYPEYVLHWLPDDPGQLIPPHRGRALQTLSERFHIPIAIKATPRILRPDTMAQLSIQNPYLPTVTFDSNSFKSALQHQYMFPLNQKLFQLHIPWELGN